MTSRLQPLSPEQHLGLGLRPVDNWAFSKTLDAVPIALSEFADLVGHHPIIFSSGPVPQPLAILGAQQGHNDFLDAKHQWPPHHSIPAVLKHYPFSVGIDAADVKRAVIAVDTESHCLVPLEEDDSALPLFTFDGKPSPTLSAITQQLGAHHAGLQEAASFGHALQQAGLLVDMHADVRLPDGSTHKTRRFRSVNASSLRNLPGTELERWFRQGWLDAIALQQASLRRWAQVFERSQRSGANASPPASSADASNA